jgi:hypothetical protein
MCSVTHGSGIHSAEVVIEVVAPFTLALDGGATVFSHAVALQLDPKVGGGKAHRCGCG